MEDTATLRTLPLLLFGAILALGSCATGAKRPPGYGGGIPRTGQTEDGRGDPTTDGAEVGAGGSRVVLVLGPGMARGLAHAGVLKALDAAGIKVGAILGSEIGALVGALYATRSTINEFEWSLLKLKSEIFARPSGSITALLGIGQKRAGIDAALESYFGESSIQDAKIPLRVLASSGDGGGPVIISRGRLAAALRAALAEESFFDPIEWEGYLTASAAGTKPYPVDEARELGIGPVIVVDVIPGENEQADPADERYHYRLRHAHTEALGELDQADLVLRPTLEGFGFRDFDRRNEIVFKGRQAVERRIAEIRRVASGGGATEGAD